MVGSSPTLLFSAYFGALDLEQAAIFRFPQGLPGFETERQFAALQIPGQHPLVYLQSVANPELCLLAFPAQAIDPGYCLEMSAEDRETIELGCETGQADVLTLAIVAAEPEHGPTANLAAPLVVNLRNNLAVQSLQPDSRLSFRYPLAPPANAC